ncbi:MAG TPA: hypothetical protein VJN88_04640, partial [Ktedonobacterales bacterium]|nr:hypothetical protein [Ktedonobacterales bacterium]
MRRLFAALLLALTVAALPVSVTVYAAPFHLASATAAASGTLTGALVNGSQRNAPIANAVVTLRTYDAHSQPQDTGSVHTDSGGRFTFANLDGSGATTYDVYTKFQNGAFTSGAVTFAKGPTQQVTLTVYATSTSDANVHVSLATILFSSPNQLAGYIPVGEYITFDNTGATAYIATPGAA